MRVDAGFRICIRLLMINTNISEIFLKKLNSLDNSLVSWWIKFYQDMLKYAFYYDWLILSSTPLLNHLETRLLHTETNQLLCNANQATDFYMMGIKFFILSVIGTIPVFLVKCYWKWKFLVRFSGNKWRDKSIVLQDFISVIRNGKTSFRFLWLWFHYCLIFFSVFHALWKFSTDWLSR